MTVKNATTVAITIPSVTTLAEVTAFPDEVMVEIKVRDGVLTSDQARELAAALSAAADESNLLDWDMETNPDSPTLVRRTNA